MPQLGCRFLLAALAFALASLPGAALPGATRALARGASGNALPDDPSACLSVAPGVKDLTQPIREAVDASFEKAERDGDVARFLRQTETTLDVGAALSTSDFWHDTRGGGRVWCLQVQTDTYRGTSLAGSLKLVFGALAAPEGAETRVYDDEGNLALGPYQHGEPGGFTGSFTTEAAVMRSKRRSSLLVAYYEPPSARGQSALRLEEVVYGFSNTTRLGESYSNNISASVEESCKGSAAWESEIRATVMLKQVNRAGGHTSGRTGVLVNNTSGDLAPLVLTAAHVVSEDVGQKLNEVGNRNFFLLNYQSAACGTPNEEPPYYAVTGGTVVAKDEEADFALIKLPERIPPAYRAHYAGWSVEESAPQRAVAIGHPRGDVKKISFEEDALPGRGDDRWHPAFDKGTIQGGHSGSPLFDENHRLRGHLIRVGFRRYAPVPASGPRLSAIWDLGPAGERVRDYLAPGGSSRARVASVAGYDLRVRGETFADLATDRAAGFFRTAGRIDVADVTVEAEGRLTLRAREGIRIEAPFRAEAGSRFEARLDDGPALSAIDFPAAAPAALADAAPGDPSEGSATAESNAAEDSAAAPGGQAEASSHATEKAKMALARNERPGAFALHPPAPNPSRGGHVTLRYALPEAARVELAVFDMLGRRVATLASGRQPARAHRLLFDAAGLASGTYLVRLRAGDFTGTQTLVLVR